MGKRPKITDVAATVTEQMVALTESTGLLPWEKGWDPRLGLPLSMSTGKAYRGMNTFILMLTGMARGFTSPWWGTYRKMTELGGQVRKGEQSTLVILWQTGTRKVEDKETGEEVAKRWATLRHYLVFCADQADGLPERYLEAPAMAAHDPIQEAEFLLQGYFGGAGAPAYSHADATAAWYQRTSDTVNVPPMGGFRQAEEFYSTAFHEAVHSTGHPSRLNREGIAGRHRFGDEDYSKEELVAEMGAAMLCTLAGIEKVTIRNSAAYVKNWLGALQNDTGLLVSAAAQAQRALDHITGASFEAEQGEAA